MSESVDNPRQNNSKQYLYIALTLLLLGMGIAMLYQHFHPDTPTPEVAINASPSLHVRNEDDANQPEEETLNDIIDKQDTDLATDTDEEETTQGTDEADDESTIIVPEKSKRNISTQPIDNHTITLNNRTTPEIPQTKYMVLTGSFASLPNARKRLEQTIIAGYQDAEIVQFDHSKYHTVCAFRTDSKSEASSAIQKLKRKGIDALLHTRR